jgi:hypothetical protein
MLADFIFIDSQGNFTCSLIFGCTQNVVYTVAAKSFDDLEIVLPRPKRPRRQFFSRYVKERFRILDIQTTIVLFLNNLFARAVPPGLSTQVVITFLFLVSLMEFCLLQVLDIPY